MASLLKDIIAGWRKGWRDQKIASLREKLIRLRTRLLSLESVMKTNRNDFPPWYVDRWIVTREEIAVTRWKLKGLGIEGTEL